MLRYRNVLSQNRRCKRIGSLAARLEQLQQSTRTKRIKNKFKSTLRNWEQSLKGSTQLRSSIPDNLPVEIGLFILEFLDFKTAWNLANVSRVFRSAFIG